ncbi:fatty acid desaturase-domain-containing protein [Crepidotus variabilis]|uniref:Fatty acid desaturase-domain-containing protein n=1 Tax=Crepidotus variabilis TaxID=179855 RepID=A0A9P6JNH8_9AGAR|nr:fatty acid desaturase-domain-containing protein [Crepidotus variabilis]
MGGASVKKSASSYFSNGPEYEARLKKPFVPPNIVLKDIHDAVPKHLLHKNPTKASLYILRDISFTVLLYKFASSITPWAASDFWGYVHTPWQKVFLKSAMWLSYWWIQGIVNAGIFCLGHDAGHGSLFESKLVSNTVGFILHTYILVPYFSWRSTHHAHHKATGSMERDENYVPYTRGKYQLPDEKTATRTDYLEAFEETPIYSLTRIFIMQTLGWWLYLGNNAMGSPKDLAGTNHFNPYSTLFKPHERNSVILTNLGLAAWAYGLYQIGGEFFMWYYLVPWILVNHWIVMFTFLHHTDPTIPHYRKPAWNFVRGAIGTVDRPLLGWMGRFFFHNISHDHVAHHFFLRAPFYNGPEITKALKKVLKDHYNYDSTPTFYALYRSFNECVFVEDQGDIIFYKNKNGIAARDLGAVEQPVQDVEEVSDKVE